MTKTSQEMKELVEGVRFAEVALGNGKVALSESEVKSNEELFCLVLILAQ